MESATDTQTLEASPSIPLTPEFPRHPLDLTVSFATDPHSSPSAPRSRPLNFATSLPSLCDPSPSHSSRDTTDAASSPCAPQSRPIAMPLSSTTELESPISNTPTVVHLYDTDARFDNAQFDNFLLTKGDDDVVVIKDNEYNTSYASAKTVITYFSDVDIAFEKCMKFADIMDDKREIVEFFPFYVIMEQYLEKELPLTQAAVWNKLKQHYQVDESSFAEYQIITKFFDDEYAMYKDADSFPVVNGSNTIGLKLFMMYYWEFSFVELFALKIEELITTLQQDPFFVTHDLREYLMTEFIPQQVNLVYDELTYQKSVFVNAVQQLVAMKADLDIAMIFADIMLQKKGIQSVAIHTFSHHNSFLKECLKALGIPTESIKKHFIC